MAELGEVRAVVELSSAVVVRPGDKLVVCTPRLVTAEEADRLKMLIAEKLPGVDTVVLSGVSQMAVYEPNEMRAEDAP
jgi:hypothetical protein